MKTLTNREVEIFDFGYNLGFRAGQLNWRKQMIAGSHRVHAAAAGERIAVLRDNIGLEEYSQVVESFGEGD